MITNKFSNISFPFFGLKEKPYEINITFDKIEIKRHKDSHFETVDNKHFFGDYFNRLVQMNPRVKFDCTCKNIGEILTSKTKWGLDKNAIIHDLTKKESFIAKNAKIKKIKDNLIWLEKVSYPFKINTDQILFIEDILYARIVYINNEWYLKEFLMEPKKLNYERI